MAGIRDAGERISGARKDFAARPMSTEDLPGMTPEEASELVRRDSVWPTPDWKAMVASGTSPATAAAIRLVRSRLASAPTVRAGGDPATARKAFVSGVAIVRDACASAPGDASPALLSRILVRTWEETGVPRRGIRTIASGRKDPLVLDSGDADRVAAEVEEGFPGSVPPWRRGLRVVPDPRTKGATWAAVRSGAIAATGATVEDCLAAAEAAHRRAAGARADAKADAEEERGAVPKSRPHLDVLERSGLPDRRGGRTVESGDFVTELGFRGVQFGNWVPQDERRKLLEMGWDAVHDMAEVLGIPPAAVSLGGTLAVSFGARGKAGMPAHYEPGQRVFNMGRMSGAGSVAHEWAHALDHWAATDGWTGSSADIRYASGRRERVSDLRGFLSNLSAAESGAFADLVDSLHAKPPQRETWLSDRRAALAVLEETSAKGDSGRARYDAGRAESKPANRKYEREWTGWRRSVDRRMEASRAWIAAVARGAALPPGSDVATSFLEEATRIGGGSPSYWTRPTELFARSFECWIHDRIAEVGGRSDYLVHGVEDGRHSGPEWRGDPYPSGDERASFAARFDVLAGALRERLAEAVRPEPASPGF